MKMPVLLNVFRILLGGLIVLMTLSTASVLFLLPREHTFSPVLGSQEIPFYIWIMFRTLLILLPQTLSFIFITQRKYKLSVAMLSVGCVISLFTITGISLPIQLGLLLVLLLHSPSKQYMQAKAPSLNSSMNRLES
ncbi:hypothetical protein D3C74_00320 [compost metagenome]